MISRIGLFDDNTPLKVNPHHVCGVCHEIIIFMLALLATTIITVSTFSLPVLFSRAMAAGRDTCCFSQYLMQVVYM